MSRVVSRPRNLFGAIDGPCSVADVARILRARHYLGPSRRGFAWSDEYGVAILASPTSRRLPPHWLELVRWCLRGQKNDGSRQWARIARWLKRERPEITTVVSYSDPSVGHTGGLYRACNWLWRPTWHRLRPPPSGNGSWNGRAQSSVKDRWIYPLRKDPGRESILSIKDARLRNTESVAEPIK